MSMTVLKCASCGRRRVSPESVRRDLRRSTHERLERQDAAERVRELVELSQDDSLIGGGRRKSWIDVGELLPLRPREGPCEVRDADLDAALDRLAMRRARCRCADVLERRMQVTEG